MINRVNSYTARGLFYRYFIGIIKVLTAYCQLEMYMPDVTAIELWWHQPNISDMWRFQHTSVWYLERPETTKLTYLPLDKMAAISQPIFSKIFSWTKRFVFWFESHRSLSLKVLLTITKVQIMAWRRIGDKPLSVPMLTQFTDIYMRHNGEMS